MVVPPMQSISDNNDGTYALHMVPLMAGMVGLPCRPCSGPQQLITGDYHTDRGIRNTGGYETYTKSTIVNRIIKTRRN